MIRALVLVLLWAAPLSAQTLLPELTALRAEYPTPMSKPQLGELLTRTAQTDAARWALLRKPSGNNCPAMAVLVSCDYLIYMATGQGYDVLIDQEGAATPVWQTGSVFGAGDFVRVSAGPIDPPDPPEPPTPPPTGPEHRQILESIDTLAELMADLEAQMAREHEAILLAVNGTPETPASIPPEGPVETGANPGAPWWADLAILTLKYVLPIAIGWVTGANLPE